MGNRILVVGTYDTKNDELTYIAEKIRDQGGAAITMDVSVLGDPVSPTDHSKHDVAAAAGSSIATAIAADDENIAMQIMASGAARLSRRLFDDGQFDGVIVLGGTMGTDLALDLCAALPLGVPKYIVSTVSFSSMIPPERLAPDVQMILWAGGLYGLNPICRSSLSQAAGAVLGAARAAEPPQFSRPLIGITGFSKTVLHYVIPLKPALEARGCDVAVFHATGMGGRAFEGLAADGAFAAVLDFAPQEVGNHLFGSSISAGPDRLTAAGLRGVPQMVAPGCADLVDVVGWHPVASRFKDLDIHAHNRLLHSFGLNAEDRRAVARAICAKLALATGPTVFFLPNQGFHCWDRPGGPLCNPDALTAFCDEVRRSCPGNVTLVDLDLHINDAAFADQVLAQFDAWASGGIIRR
jgi:uncharacterized protein (UPF0261 family)